MQDVRLRPAYLRLADRVKSDIAAGRLVPGDRLLPERTMAAGMGVAVGTLRKALARLQDDGLILRRHGSGNYVTEKALPASRAEARLHSLTGAPLAASILSEERLPAPPGLRAETALRRRRVHRAAGLAVAIEESWSLDAADPQRIEDVVGSAAVPDWSPAAFTPGSDSRVGHLRRQAWRSDDGLCEVADLWFDTARVVYRARLL